jgi:hypothetical protein
VGTTAAPRHCWMVKGIAGGRATLWSVRAAVLLALLLALAAFAACGPTSPTEAGGRATDPVALLTVLPSPGQLRGDPAAAADPEALQEALTGAPDPVLAERVRERGPVAAAVRTWTAPGGQELVAVASVWDSHLIATGVGAGAAERLLRERGARAWTPRDAPGSRGARVDAAGREARRLAFAVGPNSVYVRSRGPVPDGVVEKTLGRLVLTLEGLQD